MSHLWQDIRYGARRMLMRPGFTAAAVITLALGLGANTAIFSFVNGILFRPLPFPEPDRLVVLSEKNPEKIMPSRVSPRNLEDWTKQSQTIEQFSAWLDWHFSITTVEGTAEVASAICSPDLFRVLGSEPIRGRSFLPEENQPGHDHVVMISNRYWKSQFSAAETVIGQTMILDKQPFTIIGVLPPELEALYLGSWDVWAPLTVDPDQFLDRQARNRRVYARLKPGVTLAQAQTEMAAIAARLAEQYPKDNAGWTVSIRSLRDEEVGDLREAILVFRVAVGMVLLIACTNVANLLLARSAVRRKEFAVRVALGASWFQLLRQLLTESVLLSLLGGSAGLLLASWLIDLFIAISPRRLLGVEHVRLDAAVLGFTFLLSILTGILFGLAPGLQFWRRNLVEELKDAPGTFRPSRGMRLRALLVISQVALALMLLVGAGLLGQTFLRLVTLHPGYNPENLFTSHISVPSVKYRDRERVTAVYRQLTNEIKAIPGVVSVGATTSGPQFGPRETLDVLAEGKVSTQVAYFNTGPNYFGTMGIPVLRGRDFSDKDDGSTTQVAIVNETFARRLWSTESAVGKHLSLAKEEKATLEIVGVVGDVKRFELNEVVQPEIFFPYAQQPRWAMFFVVRTNIAPASVIASLPRRVTSIDSELIVSETSTMDQRIGRSLRRPRFNLILVGIFAGTALLLAAIGVYGVISFLVSQQTKEIGIRTALGAKHTDILKLIIGRGLVLALIGVGVGTLGALALTRFLSGLVYGVTVSDPLTFVSVSALLLLVVAIACYIPARRAARMDPLMALRYE